MVVSKVSVWTLLGAARGVGIGRLGICLAVTSGRGVWGSGVLSRPEGMGVAASGHSRPVAPTLGSSTWQAVFSLGFCAVGSRVSTLTRAAHVLSKTNQFKIHASRPSSGQHPGPLSGKPP